MIKVNCYQVEPMRAKQKRALELNNFISNTKISSRAKSLLLNINLFMSYLYRPNEAPEPMGQLIKDKYLDKADRESSRYNNTLIINPEFIFTLGIINPNVYKEIKQANNKARRLCKELMKHNILARLGSIKDNYMINPIYIYYGLERGCAFGECYERWVILTKEKLDEKLYLESYKIKTFTKNGTPTYKTPKDLEELEKSKNGEIINEVEEQYRDIEEEINNYPIKSSIIKTSKEIIKRELDNSIRIYLNSPRSLEEKRDYIKFTYELNNLDINTIPNDFIKYIDINDIKF